MAIEGKIPASGPISFGAVRGLLGENDPNYPCYVNTAIIGYYQRYLLRLPDEYGALYYQSILETGQRTLAEIEQDIANSPEAQIVASIGTAIGTVGNAENYNMNRDMFRVITKSNSNQPIKASDLRSKDNSYKEYNSPWLLNVQQRNVTPISPPLNLSDYFSGDQYMNGDTLKVTVYSHYGEGYVAWSSFGRDVINFFIDTSNYYDSGFVLNNAGGSKTHNSRVIYDPADRSIKIQGSYLGGSSGNKNAHCSLIRVEYIQFPIPSNFYQYYPDGLAHFKANHD
jgi:hypothetical protein